MFLSQLMYSSGFNSLSELIQELCFFGKTLSIVRDTNFMLPTRLISPKFTIVSDLSSVSYFKVNSDGFTGNSTVLLVE